MLDVVVDRSILEKYRYVSFFPSSGIENVKMAERIHQHCMIVSVELMNEYEKYFRQKGQEWLDWYMNYCAQSFNIEEFVKIKELGEKRHVVKEGTYYNELIELCASTTDKILLGEMSKKGLFEKKYGIHIFNQNDILDESGGNEFSKYTLPVLGHTVRAGEESINIAKWLGRFISKEKYIQIYDNYLATPDGIKNLKKYILKYIKEDTEIEIYSMIHPDEMKEEDVVEEFEGSYYSKWKVRLYENLAKRKLHTRVIQGEKYIISIDRGLSVFGNCGKTFQTLIYIHQSENAQRVYLMDKELRQII